MEFRHLRNFLAVAEELHFGHAADKVHLSQPALSMQIRALESELGVSLFARDRRKTTLTLAGAILMEDARDILARVDVAFLRAQRANRGQVGILRIGTISTAIAVVIPPVLMRFRALYPDVRIELESILTTIQISHLQDRRLDLGFVRMPIAADNIKVFTIHSEPFIAALPASHPLARKKRLRLSDLNGENFVMYARNKAPSFHDRIVGMLERNGVQVRIVQEAGEMYTLVSLVAATLGVAILPKSVEHFNIPGVAFRPLPNRLPRSQIGLAVHQENKSPFVRAFIELAQAIHGQR